MKQKIIDAILDQKRYDMLYLYGEEVVLAGFELKRTEHLVRRKRVIEALDHAYSIGDIDIMWKILKGSFYSLAQSFTQAPPGLLRASKITVACAESWVDEDGKTYRERICHYKSNLEKAKIQIWFAESVETLSPMYQRQYSYKIKAVGPPGHIKTIWLLISDWVSAELLCADVATILKSYSILFLKTHWTKYFKYW